MANSQSMDELMEHLTEQINLLALSAKSFDEGYPSSAKMMAVNIRILLHDTSRSDSLLTQLGKKDILFYTTSMPYNPANLLPHLGLIVIKMGPGGGDYIAPLEDLLPDRYSRGKVSFGDWWNEVVLDNKKGQDLSRKDLILSVCNKDGGAHIDLNLSRAYEAITREPFGWSQVSKGVEREFPTKPELVSVRQIGHEVLKSLRDEFPECVQ